MSRITWEEFYSQNVAPSNFESNKQLIESFCAKFAASDCRVVLITCEMSDPFENFQQLFASHSESFGREEKFVLDTRDLDLPVHIKWNFLGIISYLLSHPMNEHTEMILGKLLDMGRKVNNEMGNVPALTALAFQASNSVSNQQFSLTIARITRKLLENGADPLFVSRKTCRSRFTVPDALGMAAFARCVPMVRQLLGYWWPSPIYLLDSWTGHMPQTFHFLFPILMEYGWPHGSAISEDIEYFIEAVMERGPEEALADWVEFKQTMRRQPCTLKRITRILIREKVAQNASGGLDFYRTIENLEGIPQALVNFLLLKEP